MRANAWLQNPTLPVMQKQQALLAPPYMMHRAIFRVCGELFFLKLWQHLFLKQKYLWSLVHWISLRYLSSKNCLAFTKPIATMWWSLSMMDFPKFKIWKSCQITINPVHMKEKKLEIKIFKDMKIKVYENQ